MKSMRYIVLGAFYIFIMHTYAQDWQPYYESLEVKIEIAEWNWKDQKYGKDHERLIFRYTNLTNEAIQLSFERKLVFNGQEEYMQENEFLIHLGPLQTMSYFSFEADKTYYLFRKDNNDMIKQVLTDFELRNFKVSK